MGESGPKQATYCYQCGRRVGREVENCWYCGSPTRRWIRRPKRCPFCREEVQAEAVKCRHCGEFIDGRAKPAPQAPQQVVFVVDRNLLQGMRAQQDFQLLAGQPVPPEVARALDAQTVRAIESGQPRLIAQPGVRALPAPEAGGSGVIDVEPIGEPGTAVIPRPASKMETTTSQNLPARRGESAPAVAGAAALGAGKALVKAGGWLARKALAPAPPPAKPDRGDVDAEAQDLYRVCVRCQTEILTQDNYCFNCGYQYHTPKHELAAAARRRKRFQTGLFLVISLMLTAGALWKLGLIPAAGTPVGPLALALPGAGLLLSAVALVRGGGILNKIVALALGALAAAVLILI